MRMTLDFLFTEISLSIKDVDAGLRVRSFPSYHSQCPFNLILRGTLKCFPTRASCKDAILMDGVPARRPRPDFILRVWRPLAR